MWYFLVILIVTPHVGVWIETNQTIECFCDEEVTPHVGVWIETKQLDNYIKQESVTPHVGVWIETNMRKLMRSIRCHTSCRCVD